ncbi:hypothetical protein PG984_016555 [Apiospora sp. TS-2023a]
MTAPCLSDAETVFPTAQAHFPPPYHFAMADMGQTTTEPANLSFVSHMISPSHNDNNNGDSNTIALPDMQFDFSEAILAPDPVGHSGERDVDCHDIVNGPTVTQQFPSPCNSAMRRTLGNGLSFQGITKLRGAENYEEWVRAIRAAARKEGVWDMMTGTCERPRSPVPGASSTTLQEYNDDLTYWTNKRDLALGGIEGSLAESVQAMADDVECVHALWVKLEQAFKPASEQKSLYSTMQKLESLSLETEGSVERLVNELRRLQKTMASFVKTQELLPGWYFNIRFLLALGSRYHGFVSAVMTPGPDFVDVSSAGSFEQLVAMAVRVELRV